MAVRLDYVFVATCLRAGSVALKSFSAGTRCDYLFRAVYVTRLCPEFFPRWFE